MIAAPAISLITACGLLVIVAGLYIAVQVALSELSHARVEDLVEEGRRGASQVAYLMRHPKRSLLTTRAVQLGCQILAVACLTLAFASWWSPWWVVLFAVVAVGGLLLLFVNGMVAPQIGRTRPDTCALWLSPLVIGPLRVAGLGQPLNRALAKVVPPPAVTRLEARHEMVADFREMVDDLGEGDDLEIEEEDREMLRSVFEMGMTLVREIIVPRIDMVTIDKEATGSQALDLLSQSGFSRIPVTGDDSDDVRGVVYLKDLVHRLVNRPEALEWPVHELMREAHFVPETMRVDDLLRQMRSGETHLAIVFDEWGGTVGLVTIEDLIEELVGEVTDEHDKPEETIDELGPGRWRVPARLGIDELAELTGRDIDEDDVDTVGGLLQKALGKVPLEGDRAQAWGLDLVALHQEGRRRQVSAIVASLQGEKEESGQ